MKNKVNNFYTGIIKTTPKGSGFVAIENFEEDIYIKNNDLNTALNDDTVKIIIYPEIKNTRRAGEVCEIVERGKKTFVGTIEKESDTFYLNPQNRYAYTKFLIPDEFIKDAQVGYKVLAEFVKWDDPKKMPKCKVLNTIGKAGLHETEIQSILAEKEIDNSFEQMVENEAQELKNNFNESLKQELTTRDDMRDILTFTVDPDDAKDFDDALSYKETKDGDIEVGVHIADVTYFVQPNTALDREAKKRGTSVYLVDRTIPMLPEILSNDLCSLNENEDKLAFSVIFTFDQKSIEENKPLKLKRFFIKKAIINSDKRFTYADVEEILKGKGLPFTFSREIKNINILAKKIAEQNAEQGAMNFRQKEVKFILGNEGKPTGIIIKESGDANKLIENFMLLANKKVTEFVDKAVPKKDKVFLYRIHDKPEIEKVEELSTLFKEFGHNLPIKNGTINRNKLNELLESIQNKPEAQLLNISTIRSMQKAIYSLQNIGHFGLAFRQYTHFTSPIRRYPDVLVHRMLKTYLEKGRISKEDIDNFSSLSNSMSEKEKKAMNAERESIKYKQAEYMQQFIGKEIEGSISGVTEWGIFIEHNKSMSEGLLPIRNLGKDYYVFEPDKKRIVGKRTKQSFRLGDKIKVRVAKVNMETNKIDFGLML